MTKDQATALAHIRANGDDRNLQTKRWKRVKLELFHMGLLRRRIGDWAWVPNKQPVTPQ